LRIGDRDQTWRIILDVFSKKTPATPIQTLEICRKGMAAYLRAMAEKE